MCFKQSIQSTGQSELIIKSIVYKFKCHLNAGFKEIFLITVIPWKSITY